MDSSFNLAVHALVCLSHSGRSLSSEALAENICTNPTRVRRVLAGLKKAGMVETREGLDGGYRLCADPAALSLRQVAEAVNTRFVGCAWHSGDIDRDCAICSGMAGVMDALYRSMNEECAAYLSHITITDIETQLFKVNQRIIAENAQFTGIAAGQGVGFTTGLLHLRKGLGMRETPIRPHS